MRQRQKRQPPIGTLTTSTTFDGSGRSARLRDGARIRVPFPVKFEPSADSDYPTIELVVDESDGVLVTTQVNMIGSREHPIGSDDVRVYSLPSLVAMAARDLVIVVGPDGKGMAADSKEVWQSVVKAARSRTNVDKDRLEEVATLFNAGGVAAVERNLGKSRAQAYRLINRAREYGLLPAKEK